MKTETILYIIAGIAYLIYMQYKRSKQNLPKDNRKVKPAEETDNSNDNKNETMEVLEEMFGLKQEKPKPARVEPQQVEREVKKVDTPQSVISKAKISNPASEKSLETIISEVSENIEYKKRNRSLSKEKNKSKLFEPELESEEHFSFDPRSAIIYSEIINRKEF